MKKSDLRNIIRTLINEAERERMKDLDHNPPRDWDTGPSGKLGSGGTTKKQFKGPKSPPSAPPCTPPNGPGGNGLGVYANAAGAALGNGCCGKCDNLPNPTGPFTPQELTYLGPCAPHCGCC